jgi:MFS superfamily sulfate permease-like transporter
MFANLTSSSYRFTGSYIFSQTIFTYRTGVHSRWIGVLIMIVFLYIVLSPVNILQVAPLFFLGSTLIFIGWDLLYEWLIDIRSRVLLSEYLTIWGTFIAIQVVGVDFGIILGVLVAILDNIVASAQTTTVRRVPKRSRAVWTPSEFKILHSHAYHPLVPEIVFLEIGGPVFFASSLALLDSLTAEAGCTIEEELHEEHSSIGTPMSSVRSPHSSAYLLRRDRRAAGTPMSTASRKTSVPRKRFPVQRPPQFCVMDLSQVTSMDASAARTCFL